MYNQCMENERQYKHPVGGPCEIYEGKICNDCGECDMCDIDPKKVCDNCGKCLDEIKTDEKGYVKIPIDKIIYDDSMTIDDFYRMAGLDDDDDDCNCGHDHCHDDDCGCHDDHCGCGDDHNKH